MDAPGRSGAQPLDRPVISDIPARLDRLPWNPFHWLVVVALGITWILDGLEVHRRRCRWRFAAEPQPAALRDRDRPVGQRVSRRRRVRRGLFGYLTDRLGRKLLFNVTLGLYRVAAALTAFSWSFWSYALFRFLTGAGIGGEYTAINSGSRRSSARGWPELITEGLGANRSCPLFRSQ